MPSALPSSFILHPSAFCLLPSAFCLLPSAFCLLPSAFCLPMKRELTAVIAAPFAIWMVGWANPYVFDAAVALIATLALYEFLDLGKRKGYHLPITLCMAVMLFIIAAFILEPISVEMGVFLALLVIPASYVFAKEDLDQALPSSAIAVTATLYVGMLGGSLIRLRNDFPPNIGPKLVFFLILVVWLGDA